MEWGEWVGECVNALARGKRCGDITSLEVDIDVGIDGMGLRAH